MNVVLGYGSLMDPARVRALCGAGSVLGFRAGWVGGLRRHWNVLYRNGCHPTGRYVDRKDARPFAGGVAFLGIRPADGPPLPVAEVRVDDAGLAALDADEYLYHRERWHGPCSANEGEGTSVWIYRDAPADFPEGRYDGPDVRVGRPYHDGVRAAAARLLPEGLARFEATTDPCRWPVADLVWEDRDA